MATNPQDELPATGPDDMAEAAPVSAVGTALRTARERTGRDLPDVARQLRIRQPYLQALEEGRHKDLPGGTYAIGFLRTYAEFLALDGEEMVRRFKQEASDGLHSRSELVFPSPVSEGRIPNGGLVFIGVLVAVVAYGGWLWLNSRHAGSNSASALPDRLFSEFNRPASLTADKAGQADATKTDTAPVEPAHPDEAAAPAGSADSSAASSDKPKEEVVPPAEVDAPAEPAKPAEAAPKPAKDVPAKAAKAPEPAKGVKAPEAAKSEAVKPEAVKPDAAKPEAAKSEPAKPDAAKPEAAKPDAAKSEPAKPAEPAKDAASAPAAAPESGPGRVVIKASADDCWIQVREMDGRLLTSKLLRRGDTFPVPDRPGLTLTVGNAGALELQVDGKAIPSLGTKGQVRRDINLDPEKLLSGG